MTAAIGLVGYGLVGAALAARMSNRFRIGAELDATRRAAMVTMGIASASSAGEVAAACDWVVIALYAGAEVEAVLAELVAGAARPGLVCVTTLAPRDAERIGSAATAAGFDWVEMPISGTSAEIAAGEALGLVAGQPTSAARARPVIGALVSHAIELGSYGAAARAKLAINAVLEVNRSALAQGLAFATAQGLDGDSFLAALRQSAAYARVMDRKAAKMIAAEFAPEGRVTQSLKDVRLMLNEAAELGLSLPLLAAQAELLEAAVVAGDGDLDGSVVIRHLGSPSRAQAA